jgi:hypothetical protein
MTDGGPFKESRQPVSNLMNRVLESGSALVNALRDRLRAAEVPRLEGSRRRADKAIDSTKIQIRLLSNENDLPSIRRIAETTEDAELASYAVSYLSGHREELMLPEMIQLARSNSHACLPALISLFNGGQAAPAYGLLMERLAAGDYFNLIAGGKVRALLLLDILGAVDDFNKTTLCFENFPGVWHCLAERPDDREKLLAEILGDANPGGLRYSPDSNMVSQSVKIQAMQILHALRPTSYERSLWYASRDQDDNVAYTATMALAEYWQNEGRESDEIEPFTMLNLNLLFQLSRIASNFKWKGAAGVVDMYAQWTADVEELENLDARQDPQKYAFLKSNTEKTGQQLAEITTHRLNALQPVVDAVTSSLGLPHAKIRPTDIAGVAASYLVGTGTVELGKSTLLDDRPLTEEFMSSLLHELLHMEQDALIIRMIADLIGLQLGQHAAKLGMLFQRYSEAIGYAPDSIFLMEVLRLRGERQLNESERKRAERLLNAAYDNIVDSELAERLSQRIQRIEESVARIESGSYDLDLLDCLRDEHSLLPLFEGGYVPAVLIEEIRSCRAKIDELCAAAPRHGTGHRRGKSDSIAAAQDMIAADRGQGRSPLTPVMDRIRVVVSHMLAEENRRLADELTGVRRSGYHEAEAYAISDRVEVVVRALRKGWYQFTS